MRKLSLLVLGACLVSCSSVNFWISPDSGSIDAFSNEPSGERSTASVPWAEPKQPVEMETHSRLLADICKTPTSGRCERGYLKDKGNSERCCPTYRLCKTKGGAPGTQRWAGDKYGVCDDAAQESSTKP